MTFHDSLADRQADARPRIFPALQSLKDDEDSLVVLWIEADAVVAQGKHPLPLLALSGDVDVGSILAAELDRIRNQVLEHSQKLRSIRGDRGQGVVSDRHSALLERDLEIGQRQLQDSFAVYGLEGVTFGLDPRILQQIIDHLLKTIGSAHGVRDKLVSIGI